MEMLNTAEKICSNVLAKDDPSPILTGLLTVIASFELNSGPDYRGKCVNHMEQVLDRRLRYIQSLPPASVKPEEGLLLGSGYNNCAWAAMTCDDFEKAEPLLMESLEVKKRWGTEATAVFPFAECYKNLAHIELYRGNAEKAINLMLKARQMIENWRGSDSGASMLFSYILGNMYFGAGDVNRALLEHLGTLKPRKKNLGPLDPYSLDNHHAVRVLYHELQQHDTAVFHITKALEGIASWYDANIARSLYLLALIQRDQGLEADSRDNYSKARALRDSFGIFKAQELPSFDLKDEHSEIAYFDYLVPLASGRMFGLMNQSRQKVTLEI